MFRPELWESHLQSLQKLENFSNLDEDQSKENSRQSYLQVNSNIKSDFGMKTSEFLTDQYNFHSNIRAQMLGMAKI